MYQKQPFDYRAYYYRQPAETLWYHDAQLATNMMPTPLTMANATRVIPGSMNNTPIRITLIIRTCIFPNI